MATAGDGRAPYESSGAGGKFRKRPFRRSAPATPYERPPTALRNKNPGLLTKLVDPASRLIYAGAHKLFGVFRKLLPPLSLQGPPGLDEVPQNVSQEAVRNNSAGLSKLGSDQDGNAASISAATGISELEQMLKQKTFTRSEIQHLTALLYSRTTESPSDYVVKRNGAKSHSSPSPLLRLEASTSGSMKKHGDNRDNFHASVSTPLVSSKVIEEETPSPAELAKAYMGIRPTNVGPSPLGLTSQDSKLINNVTSLQKTPITSIAPKIANRFKGLENGFLTPRSRGRSAMYSMARTPYSRSPLNFNQKGIMSDATLTSSQSLKRRSSVLDDDFGSGGPLRRTRQKADLLLQSRDKRELGYTTFQQPMLLRNGPEENGHTTMRESTHVSIPAKSTQTATQIFQQLERLSPKSPTKLTSNMLHGQALRSLEKVDSPKFLPTSHDTQKSEDKHRDNGESTSRGKEKVEENGARKFPVPFNMLTTVNGDTGVSLKECAQIVTIDASTNELSEIKPKESSDPKPSHSTSVFSSDTKNDQKLEDIPAATSASAMFSFASSAKNSSGLTMTPDSSPSIFSSSTPIPASGGNTNSLFNNTSSDIAPASTSIATSSVFSTSLTPPVFSFGSANPTTSTIETSNTDAINEKEPKSTINSSLFATTTPNGGGGLFGFSSPAATSSSTTTTNGGALFGFSSPAATSTTTTTNTTNGGAIFDFSSPAATSTNTTNGGALFGFGSTAATATTTNGGALFGFSSTAATSTTTTTTASGGLFGFSSPAATSTAATAQSQGSFFNAASGSQSNTQTSSPVTQAVPFQFSSSSSLFGSSDPAFGSSPSFGISSVPATSEGKSGNSISGSTTSIFGSSWQSPNPSVFSFGASSAPTPSSTTSPITFGAPNTGTSTGSSMFSFTTSGPTKPSFGTPSQVFGNPTPAFANNNDQMSMEDSMAEDSMQTPSPVSPFCQAAPLAAPGFMFGSATPAPPQPAASFQFGVQPNKALPQNPFQSSSVEFNAGGGSFSLGSGGDKAGRRVVRINKSKNRRK